MSWYLYVAVIWIGLITVGLWILNQIRWGDEDDEQ